MAVGSAARRQIGGTPVPSPGNRKRFIFFTRCTIKQSLQKSSEVHSFDSLGLSADLLHAISDQGYTEPTPIQRQAIPVILEGKDVLAGAQTGTGKTAGFALPLLELLSKRPFTRGRNSIRALILVPTRELAAQVGESVAACAAHLPIKTAVIFGGVNINPQIEALRRGVDILVATPGRLLDHVQQRTVSLSRVEFLVLDEADRMLDMGFIRDIRKVLALLPARRQNLLFFATFSDDIKALSEELLNAPVLIEVARRNTASERVEQVIHQVDRVRKRDLLTHLIGSNGWRQVLVFTRTKHGANRLAKQLEHDGISAVAIHGNKSQAARTRSLADFKNGKVRVLVATDIASRGLDIDHLPHVVNFELPALSEDYVHRIGRTGRAGSPGTAISLVCVDELGLLGDIEHLLRQPIPREPVAGFEPDPSVKPEPIFKGRTGPGRNPGGNPRHRTPSGQAGRPKAPGGWKRSANGNGEERGGAPRDASRKRTPGSRGAHIPRKAN